MRTFYIFKVNDEFKIITKNNPYNLYLALDDIHNMDRSEIKLATELFKEMIEKENIRELNLKVFNSLKSTDYYTKFNNVHLINNYYTSENSKLTIKGAYLKLKSNINNPTFFNTLKNIPNLFVIDFVSKDYFWLS